MHAAPTTRELVEPLRVAVQAALCELPPQVILWANPGNAGDALIRVATRQALVRAGVQVLPPDCETRGRTVVIIGGGNLVPLYSEANRAISHFAGSDAERIVVLPHTIRGEPASLSHLRSGDLVMCRDEPSRQAALNSAIAADVLLAHDMAFHLDVAEILSDRALARVAEPALDARVPVDLIDPSDRAVVVLTRNDVERGTHSPAGHLDASHAFAFGGGEVASLMSAWALLTFVSRCRAIVTDRLHVGIAAALMNVSCTLLPNSYDKNQSVYEQSLRYFPWVRFEQFPASIDEPATMKPGVK